MRDHSNCSHAKTGYAYKQCNRAAVVETPLHRLARETDEALAEFYTVQMRLRGMLETRMNDLHYTNGERPYYATRTRREWPTSASECEAQLRAKLAADELKPWDRDSAVRQLEKLVELRAEIRANLDAQEPLNAIYAEHRWSRFFVVTTKGHGHIHSSMSCHSCRPTTMFGWLPQLSGKTEAEAVADQGPALCTFCYPSAPVAWTEGEVRKANAA